MDKKLLMQILVVGAALLFITELFMFGGNVLVGGNGNTQGGENITGPITFNGTIRTYDPYLLLTTTPSEAQLAQVRSISGVLDVRPDTQGYVVDTETRDDVYSVGQELQGMNLSALAVANIAAPSVMVLEFGTQRLNVTSQGVVRVATEPLFDAGEVVSVTMVGVSKGGVLIDYYSQRLTTESKSLLFSAEVSDPVSELYIYTVPWEERNNVSNSSGTYDRVDSILFPTQLTVEQIMAKKQFPYISYIDEGSAQINPSFDNKTQILENFEDVDVIFPNSTLRTGEDLDYPYPREVYHTYNLTLIPPEGYSLSEDTMLYQTKKELNGTISLDAQAVVAGNSIISIESVSLPS